MTSIKEINERYEASKAAEKAKIKAEPKKGKRFWLWVRYWLLFPFKWMWVNLRDWRTSLIFAIWALLLSSPVWVFCILGLVAYGTAFSAWAFGIATTSWLFWLGPGTPFLPLCIVLTIAAKGVLDRIWKKSKGN